MNNNVDNNGLPLVFDRMDIDLPDERILYTFKDLPDEVLGHIFSNTVEKLNFPGLKGYLDTRPLDDIACVCRTWSKFCQSSTEWAPYTRIFRAFFSAKCSFNFSDTNARESFGYVDKGCRDSDARSRIQFILKYDLELFFPTIRCDLPDEYLWSAYSLQELAQKKKSNVGPLLEVGIELNAVRCIKVLLRNEHVASKTGLEQTLSEIYYKNPLNRALMNKTANPKVLKVLLKNSSLKLNVDHRVDYMKLFKYPDLLIKKERNDLLDLFKSISHDIEAIQLFANLLNQIGEAKLGSFYSYVQAFVDPNCRLPISPYTQDIYQQSLMDYVRQFRLIQVKVFELLTDKQLKEEIPQICGIVSELIQDLISQDISEQELLNDYRLVNFFALFKNILIKKEFALEDMVYCHNKFIDHLKEHKALVSEKLVAIFKEALNLKVLGKRVRESSQIDDVKAPDVKKARKE